MFQTSSLARSSSQCISRIKPGRKNKTLFRDAKFKWNNNKNTTTKKYHRQTQLPSRRRQDAFIPSASLQSHCIYVQTEFGHAKKVSLKLRRFTIFPLNCSHLNMNASQDARSIDHGFFHLFLLYISDGLVHTFASGMPFLS